MLKRKYKWYPHIILNESQYKRVHRQLHQLYERYRLVLQRNRSAHSPGGSQLISSLWVCGHYMMLTNLQQHIMPYCLHQWIHQIPNIHNISQVVVDNCTLCVVEHA